MSSSEENRYPNRDFLVVYYDQRFRDLAGFVINARSAEEGLSWGCALGFSVLLVIPFVVDHKLWEDFRGSESMKRARQVDVELDVIRGYHSRDYINQVLTKHKYSCTPPLNIAAYLSLAGPSEADLSFDVEAESAVQALEKIESKMKKIGIKCIEQIHRVK